MPADNDIKELFEKIAGHFAEAGEDSREMFSMLVMTTLKYRDTLIKSTGIPITVGETREALGVFMETLKTHRIRAGIDKRVKDLVILWLEELKMRVNN